MANYGIFRDFSFDSACEIWRQSCVIPCYTAQLFDHHGLACLSCKWTNAFIHKFSSIHSVQNTNYHAMGVSVGKSMKQ